ncbi:MAG: hypothetical protein E6K29_16160, partial [Gammaproteobacteria bacterium]
WLLPRLPNFTSQHAGIDVQIHTSTELVDFVKTGMDAGIRFGAGTWPRLHAQKLFDEWLVPVCTPQLLQRHGLVTEARDLRHYKLLHSTYEPWTAWLLEGGPDEVWPSSGAAFDDAIAIVLSGRRRSRARSTRGRRSASALGTRLPLRVSAGASCAGEGRCLPGMAGERVRPFSVATRARRGTRLTSRPRRLVRGCEGARVRA